MGSTSQVRCLNNLPSKQLHGFPSPNAWPVRWRGVNPRSPKHWTPEILATKSPNGHSGSWRKWSSAVECKSEGLSWTTNVYHRSKCILHIESRTYIVYIYIHLYSLIIIYYIYHYSSCQWNINIRLNNNKGIYLFEAVESQRVKLTGTSQPSRKLPRHER